LEQANQDLVELRLAGDVLGGLDRGPQPAGGLIGMLPGNLDLLIEPGVAKGQARNGAQQRQRRLIVAVERPVGVPAQHQHPHRPSTVDKWQHGDVLDVGERITELGRSALHLELAAERGLEGFDRLADHRLAGEVLHRIPASNPGHTSGPARGRFDEDFVVYQAGECRPIGVESVDAAFEDTGDDLAGLERPGDVQGDLNQLTEFLLRLWRPAGPG
jgi:hypothetical protein